MLKQKQVNDKHLEQVRSLSNDKRKVAKNLQSSIETIQKLSSQIENQEIEINAKTQRTRHRQNDTAHAQEMR